MLRSTRRTFLQRSGATSLLCATHLLRPGLLAASPLGLPIGLQLYSVREMLPQDFEGTLKKLAAIGYQEVEAAGFYGRSAAEVKHNMSEAGLHCVSGHYSLHDLQPRLAEIIAYHTELGAPNIICASPGRKNPSAAGEHGALSLEDWRWNAEQFNTIGKQVKQAGLQFGYHNHTPEFASMGGTVPYDELLRLTDPALVTFEMDCGWVTVGGGDPVAYLTKFPDRISMLHVKDFQRALEPASPMHRPKSAELGRGSTDFRGIFAAAKKNGNIRHYFVEQEEFDMPPFEALQIDADYMKHFSA